MAAYYRKALTQREFEVLNDRTNELFDTVIVGKAKRSVSFKEAQELALESGRYINLRIARVNLAN